LWPNEILVEPSTTNLEEEEIMDTPGNDGNASMPEQVKRPNPWRKMMTMMMMSVVVRTGSLGSVILRRHLWPNEELVEICRRVGKIATSDH
jgi:hypothetical protein